MTETSPLGAAAASPLGIRAELEELVLKDLHGPAGGADEIVEEASVRGRYVLGLLAPRGQSAVPDADDDDDDLAEGGRDTEDGIAASASPKAATLLPSSLGLTFDLAGEATAIVLRARYGRYERTSSAEGKRVWQRVPVEGVSAPIPLKAGRINPWPVSAEYPEVQVQGLIRRRAGQWSVTVYLINGQKEPPRSKDTAWVFQPELSVTAAAGEMADDAPVFIRRAPGRQTPDLEEQSMNLLYRRTVEFAVGHGVAVHADLAPSRWDRAVRLTTRVAPAYEVPRVTPPTAAEIPALAGAVLDMQVLAETPDAGFAAALGPIADAYRAWIDEQAARLAAEGDLAPHQTVARLNLDDCRAALARIRAGLDLLGRDPQAADAFRFANRAMAQQRVRTLYARAVRLGQQPDLAALDAPANRTWYPFQLAFILLNLPALTDPTHPDRSHETQALADVLWFPTGGGKTEAYLGLTAFTLGLRRLQGMVGGYSGHAGVAVLMRYTLRLLTLQQFQRAAALICACELIRRADAAKWGAEPFRLGLWVGQRTTPNWTNNAAEAIQVDRGGAPRATAVGGSGTPHQLTNCPWCGAEIKPGRDIRVDKYPAGAARTFIFCGDSTGQCAFTARQSPDEGLPALVVDEEIYRRLPALLIATVDKFAQLPWKGETQMLFGRVTGYCPRHGFRSPEIEDADSHPASPKGRPACRSQASPPLRPPDLIIQDELHLISGPLGTLVGLYETAVDRLGAWELNGHTVRPKVIASSATIRRAREQVASLYVREMRIFPPAGLDAGDNFFARGRAPSAATSGRRYLGLCAPGIRFRTVLIRVYVALLSAAQTLYEKYGARADPWMTLAGYFSSIRELGGMRRVVDDAVRARLLRMDERGLAKRSLSTYSVEELTSRKGATDIPQILDRLETEFDPAAADARRQRRQAGQAVDFNRYPLDVLLATNMISVGVDVPRLGLMVVASQPKNTSEYIQASSRIGRRWPGLVVTVYNWARPRDLSHYERFEHYHATFYQHVEALSVTPFASRALDRGLSALLVAYVRLLGQEFNANDRAETITRDHPLVQTALAEISRRASLVTGSAEVEAAVRAALRDRLDVWLARAARLSSGARLGYQTRSDGQTLGLLVSAQQAAADELACLTSLRDVEPSINLLLNDYGMDREPGAPAQEAAAPAGEGQ